MVCLYHYSRKQNVYCYYFQFKLDDLLDAAYGIETYYRLLGLE